MGNTDLEHDSEFDNIGSLLMTWDNDCGKEIGERIAKALHGCMPWQGSRMHGQANKST